MEKRIIYPYDKIAHYVNFINTVYENIMKEQGWIIVTSGTILPNERYISTDKFGDYWQVQRIDEYEDESGKPVFPILHDDTKAWELAKKIGLILDEDGIVIGFRNKNFLKSDVKEEVQNIKKKIIL